tara:strand:+ start:52 stop:906 length:855 start_codon:yes stop_codon:yes gene_type:complete
MGILDKLLEGIGGVGNAGNTAAALGLGTAGLALAEKGYSDIGDIGREAYEGLAGEQGLAQELRGMMEFQPYTVTSATGGQFGMAQDPATGQMSYQLAASPEEQALQQQALTDASMFFGQAAAPIAQREQDVYNRMRAVMSPEEERQRLALEQRMAAQGRTGVRTAQFGGTPEQLALAQAQSEAQNQAMLGAMQFAGQEQQRQSQLGTGMLAAGYVPQAQLLNALQPGMSASERQRQAMSEQAKSYGQTYTTGLEALLQSGLGQASLAGGFGSSIASAALGGLFS